MLKLKQKINNSFLKLNSIFFKKTNFKTYEDKFQLSKRNNRIYNIFMIKFENPQEYRLIKERIKFIPNEYFCKKYNLDFKSILNDTNNKLFIIFLDKDYIIRLCFNHFYISGSQLLNYLNKIFSSKIVYPKTDFVAGMINLPKYIKTINNYKKKTYPKKKFEGTIYEYKENIIAEDKRFYTYWYLIKKICDALKLDSILVGIIIGFDNIDYLNNNIGVIIIDFKKNDTVNDIKKKFIKNGYQIYSSNLTLHSPLHFNMPQIRDYVDCIISCCYLKTDMKVRMGWNLANDPVEEVYVGAVSVIKNDGSFDLNTCISTKSTRFKEYKNYENNFFE